MIGHSLPNDTFDIVKDKGKIFISQEKGKPIVQNEVNENTIAILKYKFNSEVFTISEEERTEMNTVKKIFVTVGDSKDYSEVFFPERYFENTPMIGRPFLHGLFDCYTLVKDYFKRNFNLILPTNLQRTWEWWNTGSNLYLEHANSYGFTEAKDIKKHDLLVMSLSSPVPNHGAIYLGDNKIMHHVAGRFSTIEEFGSMYKYKLSVILRNESINDN